MEKFIRFFVKDRLVVNLIILSVVALGIASLSNIKRETVPSTDIDKMMITISYPGAGPEDVELNAVVPVEDKLKEINGIDEYTSVSLEGGARILVSIDQDVTNKQKVKDDVFRKISVSNITDLHSDVDDLAVEDMNTSHKSILKVALSSKDDSPEAKRNLFRVADLLEGRFKRIEGVSEVDMNGYLDREIHINVYPDKMNDFYISLSDVVRSIKSRNVRSSGGTLKSGYEEKNIFVPGEFNDPLDVGDVIIRTGFEQRRVRVKDIAHIEDGFEEQSIKINVNSESAVVFDIKKKADADIIKTVEGVKKFIAEQTFVDSEKFLIAVVSDDSESVISLMNVVIINAVIGFILVFAVLFVFLDLRTSYWTALGIPITLFMTLIFMRVNDFSVNILTLGAIITVLGIMVDHAIIIAEVVYEKKNRGISPAEAAVSGVMEVLSPILVSVLTTIAAFSPMLMIKGTMGKFIYSFPLIVSAALLFSLLEAIVCLPNHLAGSGYATGSDIKKNWFMPIAFLYKSILEKILRFRYGVLLSFFLLFAATIIVSQETISKFVLFWDNSTEYINMDIETPAGTSLDATEKTTRRIEKLIVEIIPSEELVSTYSQTGKHSGMGATEHVNRSTIQAKLVPINNRDRTAGEIMRDLREAFTPAIIGKDIAVIIREEKGGPPTGEPVDIKVISSSADEARLAAAEIKSILEGIEGVKDIDVDQKKGKDEVRVIFDYEKMAQYGVDVETAASAIRTAYAGTTATSMQSLSGRLDFVVRFHDSSRGSKSAILGLLVPNDSDRLIKVRDIARLESGSADSEIRHFNGDRSIGVTADIDMSKITPVAVSGLVAERTASFPAKYPSTYLLFEGEAKESAETMSDTAVSFLTALSLIYLLVVFLFRSFTQPLIVMSVIPFGLIGVLIAFTLHSVPLSFMGLIGVIGLSGVVVNDSILMVDFINRVKREGDRGKSIISEIAEGASKRLRPVIMTTVTTVAGLLPTVYGIGGDAQTLVPVVMAMAYGLLFTTLLTLFFVPSLYMINDDIAGAYIKLKGFIREGSTKQKSNI